MPAQPEVIIKHIQNRCDTAINWTTNNPILMLGENGYEIDPNTNQIIKFKIGDGVTAWNNLDYYQGIPGPPGVGGTISTDADNRLISGTDGGLYVPEFTIDLVAIYNQAKT